MSKVISDRFKKTSDPTIGDSGIDKISGPHIEGRGSHKKIDNNRQICRNKVPTTLVQIYIDWR